MPTDYAGLVPRAVLDDFIGFIESESVVMQLGNVMQMGAGEAAIPIVSFLPTAAFVTPKYGGRKPATKIEWSAENLTAEELAAVLAVPTQWIEDASFDVEGQVERALASTLARVLDAAVLFGTGAPASFPTGGIAGLTGAAATGADALEAIDAAMTAVEAQGLAVDGIASSTGISAALRAAYREVGALPGESPAQVLYGIPVEIADTWDATKGDALVGDWDYLAIGLQRDITFRTTDTGVIQDGAGEIIANLWQDNLTGIKVFMKVGAAIGQPMKADGSGPAVPWEFADWTA